MARPSADSPQQIGILLLEKFSMISFACTVEPLRETNWVLGRKAYDWRMYSDQGHPVTASNGVSVNVHGPVSEVAPCDMLIVISFDPQLHVTRRILDCIRRCARDGTMIGAVETGAWVLARAGLLKGSRATIHWENRESIAESFPDVILSNQIFEIDRRRFTASGATAALDGMLYFIREQHGATVAASVAKEFIYNRIREAAVPQRIPLTKKHGLQHPKLRKLVELLNQQLDRRIDVSELAGLARMSTRQVQRLFREHLRLSPQSYHRALRLQRARDLLRQTDMSVVDVAISCGFSSSSDFARAYRRTFKSNPLEDRKVTFQLDAT